MGLVDDIKNQVKKTGTNKKNILYFKSGTKVRVRFLQDMEEGLELNFHDSYVLGVNLPCQELYERECKYCEDEELRHRKQYVWSVWDHEAKEVKLLMGPVNNASPIPSLVAMYDTYGTLTDRDYVITKNGSGTGLTYSVVPMDKAKFKNEKAKPFSEKKTMSIIDKAFPDADDDADDEPKKKKGFSKKHDDDDDEPKKKKQSKKRDDDDDDDDDETGNDYEDMSAKELFKECKKRGIKAKPEKKKNYYVELLEEDDEESGATDDDDEWDE